LDRSIVLKEEALKVLSLECPGTHAAAARAGEFGGTGIAVASSQRQLAQPKRLVAPQAANALREGEVLQAPCRGLVLRGYAGRFHRKVACRVGTPAVGLIVQRLTV
jgi:hypothetical protein